MFPYSNQSNLQILTFLPGRRKIVYNLDWEKGFFKNSSSDLQKS